jgi:hypothetical protein
VGSVRSGEAARKAGKRAESAVVLRDDEDRATRARCGRDASRRLDRWKVE